MKREIYLAGGCFWGMQGYFKRVLGVLETSVGYANGNTSETDYSLVKYTDHAETLHVTYDDSKVSLVTLLKHLFRVIDPTSINRQGGDVGRQYRTGVYYVEDSDKKIIEDFITSRAKDYDSPIVVEVRKLHNFVLAEDYHQDYLDKNPDGYCHINLALAYEPLND